MSATERADLLAQLRTSLESLAEDGIDYLPRAQPQAPRERRAQRAEGERSQDGLLASSASSACSDKATALERVRTELGDCTRCALCERRKKIVFGEGSPDARVVFVGEGPGADEDRTGRPFVGRAGELLTRMIEALGWKREDVYICNIVKCRPPGNRDPRLEEVATCRPFLDQQLSVIQPDVIVTLGKPATSTLLGRNVAITKVRGIWQEWNGVPVMPTLHPAYVLRQYTRETRQAVWDDLRAVRDRVEGA